MSERMPDFAEWLDENQPGWVLREDAPPEIVKKFEEYQKHDEENRKQGIDT